MNISSHTHPYTHDQKSFSFHSFLFHQIAVRMSGSNSNGSLNASNNLLWIFYCNGSKHKRTQDRRGGRINPKGAQRGSAAHSCGHSEPNLPRLWGRKGKNLGREYSLRATSCVFRHYISPELKCISTSELNVSKLLLPQKEEAECRTTAAKALRDKGINEGERLKTLSITPE